MAQQSRILLITPHDAVIEPSTDQIAVRRQDPTDWTSLIDELPEFTHLAVGPASGVVRSDDLLNAVNRQATDTAVLLPLAGYEWIRELGTSQSLLLTLTCVTNGALVVAPARLVSAGESPQWLIDAGYRPVGSLLDFLNLGAPVWIGESDCPVAAAGEPFHLPLLVPDPQAAKGNPEARAERLAGTFGTQGTALLAGCFQMDDLLDASHALAQSIEGHPDGDYWHAIMHRREPDYGNSKYWFRHVGRHPVFAPLASRAAETMNDAPTDVRSRWASRLKVDSGWDPFAFVDMCESAAGDEESDLGMTARRIQWSEMLLLLRHCARQ